MDPFSAEGELVNMHNAFHQGQYTTVTSFPTTSLSPTNALPAHILQLRARIALGEASTVISELSKEISPDLVAVRTLAQFSADPEDEEVKENALALSKKEGDNVNVQLLCGIVLAGVGLREEAIALLMRHQGSLDAVALLVQIHLSQNRLDLAQQEVRRAKSWAQDNLLVNLADSWVGLREGGEKYQSAFYVYEELATGNTTTSPNSILGQVIAELHLGRLPEAEAALTQAIAATPDDPDLIANAIVLNTILGKDAEAAELKVKLEGLKSVHVLVGDLKAKRELFESARGKYNPRFEVEV